MRIERKDALKSLWAAIEDTTKALKALSDNPVVTSSVTHLWDSFTIYQKGVRILTEKITLGNFYKISSYDKSYIILKAEYFDSNEGIGLKVKVLTSSNKRFNYNDIKDDMIFKSEEILNHTFEEIEINPQELPLYIGNEFLGSLFKELMTEAGLPVPESPQEPKEEE